MSRHTQICSLISFIMEAFSFLLEDVTFRAGSRIISSFHQFIKASLDLRYLCPAT